MKRVAEQTEFPAPTLRLTIDRDALAANWQALDKLSGGATAGAAVKANCYGLGVDKAVPVLRDAGVRDMFVAHWSEVPAVLAHVEPAQVSVLHGPLSTADVAYARQSGVVPVINSLFQARLWHQGGGGRCHVMVDTGMNRLGVALEDLSDPVLRGLEVDMLMSHLACADEDNPMNDAQLERFHAARQAFPSKRLSLANSAGIALGSRFAFDVTRPGLSLYGGIARDELAGHIQQVAYPQAAILQTRVLKAGSSIGYNAMFTASRDMPVGIVSLGYADGLLRCWGGIGALQHEGRELPLLGRISMDMVAVDLSDADDLVEGDWLDLPYVLQTAAQKAGLSQYELLTVLGRRLSS